MNEKQNTLSIKSGSTIDCERLITGPQEELFVFLKFDISLPVLLLQYCCLIKFSWIIRDGLDSGLRTAFRLITSWHNCTREKVISTN